MYCYMGNVIILLYALYDIVSLWCCSWYIYNILYDITNHSYNICQLYFVTQFAFALLYHSTYWGLRPYVTSSGRCSRTCE